MSEPGMKSAYRIAQELLRDRLRQRSPETLELLQEIHAADVIVVEGQYDHIEAVLSSAGTPFTAVQPRRLDQAKLRPDQVVFINCPGKLGSSALRKLEAFVREGGFLFTTDWALKHVIQEAFPGFLQYNEQPTRDEVVRIEVLDSNDSFLQSILDQQDDPQWWLEASSYPIRIIDEQRVRVLIRSKELEQLHGEAPVFVNFAYGQGQIYHMISHFYLQRSETRTARHAAPSTGYLMEKGVALYDIGKYQELGSDNLPVSAVESALSSNTMILGVLLRKKELERKRSKGA